MKKIAMLFPLIAGSCWGAGGIFVRTLKTAGFGNISIMCSRSLVSFCLLLIVLLLYDRSLLRIHLRDLPFFLSAAVNGYLLMNVCYNTSVGILTLTLASVLLCLCPIFVLLLGAVFFHEKITPVKVSCMLAAVVGCALISGVFDSHSELVWSSVGILTGLGSAFFNAIYTINSKQLTERNYHALTINIYVFAITTLILTPFADWNAIGAFVSAAPLKGSAFYFAQALVTSILPNFFYAFSIKYIDSGNAAILSCGAEPTAAMLLAALHRNSRAIRSFGSRAYHQRPDCSDKSVQNGIVDFFAPMPAMHGRRFARCFC